MNSWEAKYFDVNNNNIIAMAHQASKIGVNLIVLDDGWFGKRNDDMSSLGDWLILLLLLLLFLLFLYTHYYI